MVGVGNHAFPRVNPGRVQPQPGKGGGDDLAGQQFPEREQVVGAADREFAHRRNAAQQNVQFGHKRLDLGTQFRAVRSRQKLAGYLEMSPPEPLERFEARIAVPPDRALTHVHQLIGDFGHRTDHHDRPLFATAGDDFGDAPNRRGVFD
jgi:hypothetical protein